MGYRYEPHSDMCGCDRCAQQADSENPQQVFDRIKDENILDCGCERGQCDCARWDGD